MVNLGDVTPVMFGFTEVTLDQLPYRIIGWAQATCPYDSTYAYRKHLEASGLSQYYEITACEDGPQGSHGGCSTCAMCEVVVDLKAEYYDGGGNGDVPTVPMQVNPLLIVGAVVVVSAVAYLLMSAEKK